MVRSPRPSKENHHGWNSSATARRVVFQYLVPVHLEVEDGLVTCVTVSTKRPSAIRSSSKATKAICQPPLPPQMTGKTGRPGSSDTDPPLPSITTARSRPRGESPRGAGLFLSEAHMADYFTHFSCLLDVGTTANAARALDLYNALSEAGASEAPPSSGFSFRFSPSMAALRSGCATMSLAIRSASSSS